MYCLRKYQQEAVDATLSYFRRHRHPAVIVLPTGAGKSLVIAELAKIAKGRVLVLAHVKELVEQNYEKYISYDLEAGIFSAGLNRKDSNEKVIFGSIQSVARADDKFFQDFSLLIIDECHRVEADSDTQYSQVIKKLSTAQPEICILGLTATPYRLGSGWIYQYNQLGILRTEQPRFFARCIYDLSLRYMIKNGFLTMPVRIDSPVACYDFSSLNLQTQGRSFSSLDVENILKDQKRVTPGIVKNIIEMSKDRLGVMIFTSSVRHAEEILSLLPHEISAMILGDTVSEERDHLIEQFKRKELKFLVNVSVLTTGFDAPHVDVIAILRPTESISLYQQIIGRGLRLYEGKSDCLILDYTGVGYNIFTPEIDDRRPTENCVAVQVECPTCLHINDFWGIVDHDGEVIEHFGRKCRGATEDPQTFAIKPCGYRFRFKKCHRCDAENDIAARVCSSCNNVLVDSDTKLKEAMSLKDAHVMRPDTMIFEKDRDKKGRERLKIRYYDLDAKHLTEYFYIDSISSAKAFYYNFIRMHNKLPERILTANSIDEALALQPQFRMPLFIIARKQDRYWQIREKIFE